MAHFVALIFLVFSTIALSLSATDDVITVASLSNDLGAELHKKFSLQDDNVFFSPPSISAVIAMVMYGARGQTAEEMRRVMGYEDERLSYNDVHKAFKSLLETYDQKSAAEYVLYMANAVMTQKGFPILPEYKNGLQNFYNATAREVDFQNGGAEAVQEINDWVKLNTNNQIKKLVNYVDPSTVMAFFSAIYFKGTWKTQFDPLDTFQGVFYNKGLASERTNVSTMMLVEELPYARFGGFQALGLPYKGEDISMVILLPHERDGLPRLQQELNRNFWRQITNQMRTAEVTVTLPKFKMEYEKTLSEALQDYGLKSIFSNPDLSGISTAGLKVTEVIHKAVIEVNEEGSEASGISGGLLDFKMGGDDKNVFFADHPFLCAIIDKPKQLVLFEGHIGKL